MPPVSQSLLRKGIYTTTAAAGLQTGLRATPVISEFHYHPAHADLEPEPLNQEWIEIYNPDAAGYDLSGCQFSSGVDFTFPAGTVIPAGGYLTLEEADFVFGLGAAAIPVPRRNPGCGGWLYATFCHAIASRYCGSGINV